MGPGCYVTSEREAREGDKREPAAELQDAFDGGAAADRRDPVANLTEPGLSTRLADDGREGLIRMSEEPGVDVGVAYRSAVRGWIAAVQGVGAVWTARTPCTEWDVRQLVNHVVGEDRWTRPLVEGFTIAEVGDALDGDLLGEEPKIAARAAADEAVAAVEVRLPDAGTVHLSYGQESIVEYLWQLTADHLIHTWDLAAATGQDRALDPGLVDAIGTWFAEREPMYRTGGAIGARPDSATGGTPSDDLLIAFGRDPAWTAEAD